MEHINCADFDELKIDDITCTLHLFRIIRENYRATLHIKITYIKKYVMFLYFRTKNTFQWHCQDFCAPVVVSRLSQDYLGELALWAANSSGALK